MTATTIKVDSALRDRIAALAKERGMTQQSVIEFLLEEYVWSQRMAEAREAMRAATPEDLASYRAETAEWERSQDLDWPDDD